LYFALWDEIHAYKKERTSTYITPHLVHITMTRSWPVN
jgi:hypothetical protein